MKAQFLTIALLASALAATAAVPTLENVTMRRDGRRLTIGYRVKDGPAIVTLHLQTNGVPLDAGFTVNAVGDVNRIVDDGATGKVRWRATAGVAELSLTSEFRAELRAWSLEAPPDYVVFDLDSEDPKADTRFYASAASIPGGIGSEACKTDLLVMRKIPAAGREWIVGIQGSRNYQTDGNWTFPADGRLTPYGAAFTRDYYMAVYELTQGQCENRWLGRTETPQTRGTDGWKMKPLTRIFYSDLRGGTIGAAWPTNVAGHAASDVDDGSIVKTFRDITGIDTFDIPTEAQWEFAARAGVTAAFADGTENVANYASDVALSNRIMRLGWCKFEASMAQIVGLKDPNQWGLYDTTGNVNEYCRDWYIGSTFGNWHKGEMFVDPCGPAFTDVVDYVSKGGTRIVRGGSYIEGIGGLSPLSKSSTYTARAYSSPQEYIGARLCCDADMTALANK